MGNSTAALRVAAIFVLRGGCTDQHVLASLFACVCAVLVALSCWPSLFSAYTRQNVSGPLHRRPSFQMRAPISFSGLICSVSQLLMREPSCSGNLCRDSHSHASTYEPT